MFPNLKSLFQAKKLSLPEAFPNVYAVFCVNQVLTLADAQGTAPNFNLAIAPPFFRATGIPVSKKRVEMALDAHIPTMLYNTMNFGGAPIDDELIEILEGLDTVLRDSNMPWTVFLKDCASRCCPPTKEIEKLDPTDRVALQISRPLYEDLIESHILKLQGWFYAHWEAHRDWLKKIG